MLLSPMNHNKRVNKDYVIAAETPLYRSDILRQIKKEDIPT